LSPQADELAGGPGGGRPFFFARQGSGNAREFAVVIRVTASGSAPAPIRSRRFIDEEQAVLAAGGRRGRSGSEQLVRNGTIEAMP
jgi:hypothetical protein